MLFQQESLAFQLFDVLYLQQGYSKTQNTNRHYDALSFRIRSDTVIDDGKTRTHLKDGSIAYFPANFEYTRVANHDDLIVVHFKCFNFAGSGFTHFLPQNPEKYEVLFRQLLDLWNRNELDRHYQCAAVFCQILAMLYKEHLPGKITHAKIEPSIRYIRQNMLNRDFSLAEAAKRSYISDVYFRQLFKKAYGISPKQYVISQRIQRAASLILSGSCSLQEVAEHCGYSDYKHFTSEFKRIMGVSPSQYEYNHFSL